MIIRQDLSIDARTWVMVGYGWGADLNKQPSRTGSNNDPPASSLKSMGLHVCATRPSWNCKFKKALIPVSFLSHGILSLPGLLSTLQSRPTLLFPTLFAHTFISPSETQRQQLLLCSSLSNWIHKKGKQKHKHKLEFMFHQWNSRCF